MIIDEPMKMDVGRSFKATAVGGGGGFFDVKSVELSPPLPRMARQTYLMEQYFNKIEKESIMFASSLTSEEDLQAAREAHKTSPVKPAIDMSQAFAEDSEAAREAKLEEIEKQITSIKSMIGMCSNVNMYDMTTEFGKMIVHNNLCTIKGLDENQGEVQTSMTLSLWENNVWASDRVAMMVRYCCFFDLISSLSD